MRKMMVVLPLVLVLVMLVGCQKPPQADIDAAKAALDGARSAEATDYAPDSLKAAEDSQAQLDAELKVQEQKFALFRSYKKATEIAQATKAAGEKAVADAKAKKEQVKGEAQTLITEAKTALDEAKALLEKAPKGKGTDFFMSNLCEPNIAHDNCDFIKCEGIETETEVIETSGTSLTPPKSDRNQVVL